MNSYRMSFNTLALCLGLCLFVSTSQTMFAQANEGIELFHSGAYKDAESKLRESLKAGPSGTTTRYFLGLALLNQEKYPEALKELLTVENDLGKAGPQSRNGVPSVCQIDLALAKAHLELGQYEKAWTKLQSAEAEDPNSSDVFMYRGLFYYKQGKYADAIKDLEKAISLNPENAYAYYYVGETYFKTEEYVKMVEVFRMFIKLNPAAPEAPEVKKRIDAYC